MQDNKLVTSEVIGLLRFPMAVGVVVLHCLFIVRGWQFDKLAEQGFGSNVVSELLIVSRMLSSYVVALFYLFSGYLFFGRLHDWYSKVWKQKMLRRIWTLLIPYILWNTLFILFMISPMIAGCAFDGKPWSDVTVWVDDHGGWLGLYWNGRILNEGQFDLWGNPAHTTVPILLPFYFIRNLLVLCLFSPLFHFLLRERRNRISLWAIVTMSVLAFCYLTQTSFLISGFTAEVFFFFGWGAFMSLNRYCLSEVFYPKRKFVELSWRHADRIL